MTEVVEVISTQVVGVVEVDQQVVELAATDQHVVEVGYTQPGGTLGDAFYSTPFNSLNSILVTHDLGKRPAVVVVDTFGRVGVADVTYIDDNSCMVTMTYVMSGTIYCN